LQSFFDFNGTALPIVRAFGKFGRSKYWVKRIINKASSSTEYYLSFNIRISKICFKTKFNTFWINKNINQIYFILFDVLSGIIYVRYIVIGRKNNCLFYFNSSQHCQSDSWCFYQLKPKYIRSLTIEFIIDFSPSLSKSEMNQFLHCRCHEKMFC
jgi:hypothetical protein